VIEAAPEVVVLKRKIYRRVFDAVDPEAIVVSNTSSILPDTLAHDLSDTEAARFAIAHYWHPPYRLPLVEIVPGTRTHGTTTQTLRSTMQATGSHPVVLSRAVPGFIGNRIQFAVLREALHLLESGVADADTIDDVVRFSLGRRYAVSGPIESADLGGLQTFEKVATLLLPELASGTEALSALRSHVAAGKLGAAAAHGFFEWSQDRLTGITSRQQSFDSVATALDQPNEKGGAKA
jgi:3-hydroxybutyryl-CoA dehydrogenase